MKKNIVIVAAHPDDEILGCGGVMVKALERGDNVHVCFLTDGVPSEQVDTVGKRREMATEAWAVLATEELGIDSFAFLAFEDQQLQGQYIGKLAEAIAEFCSSIEESTQMAITDVYTHWVDDLNEDHSIAAKATLVAIRPSVFPDASIFSYEVPSSSEWGSSTFSPNHFVWLTTRQAETKLASLAKYTSELKGDEHPRSINKIDAQMRMRGSAVCSLYAEAFQVVRTLG